MSEPSKRRSPRKADNSGDYIDLSLRLRNDGGPVYAVLSAISDGYARGDRARHLLSLGLMVERTSFAPLPVPTPSLPLVEARVSPVMPSPTVPATSSKMEEPVAGPDFEPDDLSAIFGTAPQIGG